MFGFNVIDIDKNYINNKRIIVKSIIIIMVISL